jgi:hypothetical protein
MIRIKFETENAAFEQNPDEVADILQALADYWRIHGHLPGVVRDTNGNSCGSIEQGDIYV